MSLKFNSLAPGKFEWNFRYAILKQMLVIDDWGISLEFTLIWMSLDSAIDLARNGNSGCANETSGCAKCLFWWKSPRKWKNCGNFRVCKLYHCLCKTQVHRWLAKTMDSADDKSTLVQVMARCRQATITKINFKIVYLKSYSNFHGDNELNMSRVDLLMNWTHGKVFVDMF